MANYEIDIDSPYPVPDRKVIERKPEPLPYPKHNLQFRNYGLNVERMIEKAKKFTDPEKQQAYIHYLANYMKLVHNNWNKENVSDEVIREDIKMMSGGELELALDAELQTYRTAQQGRSYGKHHRKNGGKNKNRGNNQNRNFKRNK